MRDWLRVPVCDNVSDLLCVCVDEPVALGVTVGEQLDICVGDAACVCVSVGDADPD